MSNKTDSLWLVSSLTPFTNPSPVSLCKSKDEADALIAKLEAALPKGDLTMFSRVPVEVDEKPSFRSVKSVALTLATFE